MADLQSYRFEPGRVSNPEDSESENEEVNDRFRRHILVFFWAMSNHANAKRMGLLPRTVRGRKQNSR